MKLSSIFNKKSHSLKAKSPSDIIFPIIFIVLLAYSLVMCMLLLWGVFTSFKAPGLADYDFNKAGLPRQFRGHFGHQRLRKIHFGKTF